MLRLWWVPIACLSLLVVALPASADEEPLPEPSWLIQREANDDAPVPQGQRVAAPEMANLLLLQSLGVQLPPWLAVYLPADAPAEDAAPQPASAPQDGSGSEDEGTAAQQPPEPEGADPVPRLVQPLVDKVAPVVQLLNERLGEVSVPELDGLTPDPPMEPAPADVEAAPRLQGRPSEVATQTTAVAPAPAVPPAVLVVAAATAVAAVGGASLVAPNLSPRAMWSLARRVWVVPLYARLAKSDLLDHETRQRIVEAIEASPGLAIADLETMLSVKTGTIRHHLRALEANGLVVSVQSGRRRCFFRAGALGTREARIQQAVLSAPAARRVFGAIQRRPGIRQRELARTLGVTPTSIIFHARRLEAAGVVRCAREGRTLAYFPSASV